MGMNGAGPGATATERIFAALDPDTRIEVPPVGFANTGTRFGKFSQAGAATTIEEKFADASQVNKLTGASPTVALHVLWDLPNGKADVPEIKRLEGKFGVKAGSINPNLFQAQEYKFGSICNPSAEIRGNALAHLLDSVEIGRELGSKDVSLWIADGSNYPGSQSIRKRIEWMEEVLASTHAALDGRRTSADAGRVQTNFEADNLLPHRHRRLGHGAGTVASRGSQGQGSRGYRPSPAGHQH